MASLIVPFIGPIYVNFSTAKVKAFANELLVSTCFEVINATLLAHYPAFVVKAIQKGYREWL